jgi:hypothetical protein
LLSNVKVAPVVISPNADGKDDVTHIKYQVGRSADVSIYFVDAAGGRRYFRNAQRRSPGKYDVYWGGVINDPQVRMVDGQAMVVESQVLPDGVYTWVIEAVEAPAGGHSQTAEGQITLQGADTSLPELHNFTVIPQVFRPNQDGLRDDRVAVSYYLTKKAERAQVYLAPMGAAPGDTKLKYPVAEKPSASTVEPGATISSMARLKIGSATGWSSARR